MANDDANFLASANFTCLDYICYDDSSVVVSLNTKLSCYVRLGFVEGTPWFMKVDGYWHLSSLQRRFQRNTGTEAVR
jgi:hypothetical protein